MSSLGIPWLEEGNWLWKLEDAMKRRQPPGSLTSCHHDGFRNLIRKCWEQEAQRVAIHHALDFLNNSSLFDSCKQEENDASSAQTSSQAKFNGENSLPLFILSTKSSEDVVPCTCSHFSAT